MRIIIRLLSGIVFIAFLLWAGAIAFLYVNQDGMIFPAPAHKPQPAAGSGFLPLQLSSSGGVTLNLLQHMAEPGESWVIAFHGNGGDAVQMMTEAAILAEAGFGVLIAEYRGYNGSSGTPSQQGLYADALTAFDDLKTRTQAPIHIYAHSLGTAMAIHVAENREVAGVALLSPFDSVLSVAQARYPLLPLAPFLKHPFPSSDKIAGVVEPVIIYHGDSDAVVPLEHGRALHASARQGTRLEVIAGAGHNDLHAMGITARAAEFFRSIDKRQP